MRDRLKESFGQIQAEEELKNSTKRFLAQKTRGYTRTNTGKKWVHTCAAACICMLLMLFGGRWLYFTSTAEISIDINPSIELSLNRFDQVISVNGFNEEGRELIDTLDVRFKNYADAVKEILGNDRIAALLSNDEVMTITVTGSDKTRSAEILSGIETCTAEQRNAYCYLASSEELEAAHEMGLSYGKYRAFLEVQKLDPTIAPEALQGMTMREIRELINSLSEGRESGTSSYDERGYGHHGFGGCRGKGQGNGRSRREKSE